MYSLINLAHISCLGTHCIIYKIIISGIFIILIYLVPFLLSGTAPVRAGDGKLVRWDALWLLLTS